jgi:hypothetical protein
VLSKSLAIFQRSQIYLGKTPFPLMPRRKLGTPFHFLSYNVPLCAKSTSDKSLNLRQSHYFRFIVPIREAMRGPEAPLLPALICSSVSLCERSDMCM